MYAILLTSSNKITPRQFDMPLKSINLVSRVIFQNIVLYAYLKLFV